MRQVIYETKGRAREFNELAINLFDGCEHGCIYCYGSDVLHKSKESFAKPNIRITAHDVLESARRWKNKGETRRVLLCFISDPYTPFEQETMLTRKCIMALHEAGLNVIILTKGGLRSMRDFDLLTPQDAYATTLTCLSDKNSLYWEPKAALPAERIKALIEANKRGIETWVSLEPVIFPLDALTFVRLLHKVVGHWKCGLLNYHQHKGDIDWYKYGWSLKNTLDSYEAKYYFKQDLLKEMRATRHTFRQTWIH